MFVLSAGCDGGDVQTKPSWIYFQSEAERERDAMEGRGHSERDKDRVVERCATTPQEKIVTNYDY